MHAPILDLDLQHHMSWSLVMFNDLRGEEIVRFVAIVGIVDHQWFNLIFLFILVALYI